MTRFAVIMLLASLSIAPLAVAQPAEGECVEGLTSSSDHDARIVRLAWDATPGAVGYQVGRVLDGGPQEIIATLGPGTTNYTDSPAPEGVLDYRVASDGPPSEECPAVSLHIGGDPGPPDEPFCVGDLEGEALPDGRIRIDWPTVPGGVSYDVLRAEGDGPLVPYAFVGDGSTEFTDSATTVGVSYTYAVAANGLPPQGERCEEITITAIPYFLGGAGALAVGLVVVAFVAMRRRN